MSAASTASPARTTSTAAPAITATGLTKSYGDEIVLNGIDLNIAEGTIWPTRASAHATNSCIRRCR